MGKGRPATSGGVEPLGDSIRIRFTYEGKRQAVTLPDAPTKANLVGAAKLRRRIVAEIEAGVFDLRKYLPGARTLVPGFKDYTETFMAAFTGSRSYRQMCQTCINSTWVPAFGDEPLDTIKHSRVKGAVATASERLAPKSVNNYLTVLRDIFEMAMKDEIIDVNPARGVPYLKVQRPEPDPFSLDEANMIVADMSARYPAQVANYFDSQFSTGLRPSEAIAVTWADLDVRRRKLRINKARVLYQTKETKTYKPRWVDLNDRAFAAIERQRAHTYIVDRTGVIFRNPVTGNPWADPGDLSSHYWRPALERTKLRHRDAYNCRHTYATVNLMIGVPLAYVSKQLGHASIETTLKYYYHWIEDADNGVAAAASNAAFGQTLATKAAK